MSKYALEAKRGLSLETYVDLLLWGETVYGLSFMTKKPVSHPFFLDSNSNYVVLEFKKRDDHEFVFYDE